MLHRQKTILLLLAGAVSQGATVPEEYVLTNITGWSDVQLASLPHFDRYVPLAPVGAGVDFVPVAHNGLGLTAGNRDYSTSWVQGSGAYVEEGVPTDVPAWLRVGSGYSYSWSYTYWDGRDYHFSNGFVTHSPAQDVNCLGQVVGYATMPGSGSGSGSSSGYRDHLWLRDTVTGAHHDLTPEATRAGAGSINDLGQIVGFWRNATESHPFLRHPDGIFEDLSRDTPTAHSITPTVVNNHRLIAGNAIVYTTPLRDQRAWVCESGSVVTPLPFPSQNSPDVGTIADVNDHGILVGEAHKAAAHTETNAVRWSKVGGSWQADDLNELIDDNMDFIVDRAIAVNDAGHILCSGHADGFDTHNTHKLLLTPVGLPEPTVTTLPPIGITATGATLRAKLNAAGLASTAGFEYGVDASYGTPAPLPPMTGTVPVLAEEMIGGLSPHTTYHYRAVASNATGSAESLDTSFTTAWDWPSWASSEGLSGPEDDANGNGVPDLIDYATDREPRITLTVSEGATTIGFVRSTVADGVTLTLEVSDDLSIWFDGPTYGISGSSGSTPDAAELSRVATGDREIISITTSHRFARLRADLP